MASKELGPLPRRRGSALAHGCGRSGRVVLPLPRAAAVSTGLRVREGLLRADVRERQPDGATALHAPAQARGVGRRPLGLGRG